MKGQLTLRIIVRHAPAGVVFRVQRGRSDLLPPSEAKGDSLSFAFSVRVVLTPGEEPNFLGDFAQGPRSARFVYVNSGQRAGQKDTCWDRRAKVPLGGITPSLAERALTEGLTLLEACFEGTGRDGGPACGTVRLLEGGWRPVVGQPPLGTYAVEKAVEVVCME